MKTESPKLVFTAAIVNGKMTRFQADPDFAPGLVIVDKADAEAVRFDRIEKDLFPTTPYEMSEARQLWRDLVAKWKGEGVAIFVTGGDLSECWNLHQEAGWMEAARNWNAAIDQTEYKPMPEADFDPDANEPAHVAVALDFDVEF